MKRVLAILGCAALAGGIAPADAALPTIQGQVAFMVAHSLKCLDVGGNSHADGAGIIQYGCNGMANQQWTMESVGLDGSFRLRVGHSGSCLHSPDSTEGSRLVQWSCNSSANQRWSWAGDRAGLLLRVANSGMCVDVFAYAPNDWAPVVQWRCNIAFTNQQMIPR